MASAVLALGGYAGLIWARAKLKTPLVRVLCGLFGVALVAYLPATLFVCVTAFGRVRVVPSVRFELTLYGF